MVYFYAKQLGNDRVHTSSGNHEHVSITHYSILVMEGTGPENRDESRKRFTGKCSLTNTLLNCDEYLRSAFTWNPECDKLRSFQTLSWV